MKTTRSLPKQRILLIATGLLVLTALFLMAKPWASGDKTLRRFEAKPGPWGQLECVRIAVEMPEAFISLEEIKNIHAHWFLKGSRNDAIEFFKSSGLSETQINLLKQCKWEETIGGYWISPPDEFVLSLSKAARRNIYSKLSSYPENVPQSSPFIFREERLLEVLQKSELTEATIGRFKELLYSQDNFLLFADTDIFVNCLESDNEKIRFLKTISRTATLLVKLNVDEHSDVEGLVKYWGYGGRSKDVRSLLQSMAAVPGGSKVDVAHLLPSFVRQRIYNYPNPDMVNVTNQHCHWTSMNFLNPIPEDRFSEESFVRQAVETQFVPVSDSPRLGDVIFFLDGEGMVIHSVTYIADNIVFTKNGGGANRPWVYMEMEDVITLYLKPREGMTTVIYRRKSV